MSVTGIVAGVVGLDVDATTDEMALKLLHATREQLHHNPARTVQPTKVAEKAGIDPYRIAYVRALGYLLDHGYVEPFSEYSPSFYRVTCKGLEEILSSKQLRRTA